METPHMTKQENSDVSKTELQPDLKREFEIYRLWKVIPIFWRNPPRDKKTGLAPTIDEYCEQIGIDDEGIMELIKIKNQTEFCARFNVHKNTLTEWNKKIENSDVFADMRKWTKILSKNVLMAMYSNAMNTRNLNADRDRVNFLKFGGWVEKTGVEHSADESLTDFFLKALKKPDASTTS